MDNLFNVVLQTLRDRLPGVSWKVGSLVRELIVEPLTVIGDALDTRLTAIKRQNSIDTALADPVQNDDILDAWINRLHITLPESRKATGSLMVTFTGTDSLDIPRHTEFIWGDDIRLRSLKAVHATPELDTDVRQLATGVYYVVVDVETNTDNGGSISYGSKLNWEGAPDRVLDICVNSAITGGIARLSSVDKARLIEAKLGESGFCGEDAMLNAIVREFGNAVCDVRFGAREYVDGMPRLPVYIKQVTHPVTMSVELYKANTSLYEAEVAQCVEVCAVYDGAGRHYEFDAEYLDNQVSITTKIEVPSTRKLFADVRTYADTARYVSWLNSRTQGITSTVVAATPVYCDTIVNVPTDQELPYTAVAAVSSHINSTSFDGRISDDDIKRILSDFGVTVNKPITYTVKIRHHNIRRVLTQTGGVLLDGILSTEGKPVAVYCSTTNVRAI